MALDRGTLAKIDRQILAELDHGDGTQAVKLPLSDAAWSTWRRYCEALGLSMGEGVARLIAHELETIVSPRDSSNIDLVEQAVGQAQEQASRLDVRERELEGRAERLRMKEAHLSALESRISAQRASRLPPRAMTKVGRNERCPCRSGLKYKHCHGLAAGRIDNGGW